MSYVHVFIHFPRVLEVQFAHVTLKITSNGLVEENKLQISIPTYNFMVGNVKPKTNIQMCFIWYETQRNGVRLELSASSLLSG